MIMHLNYEKFHYAYFAFFHIQVKDSNLTYNFK